jgi:hypothetical protein
LKDKPKFNASCTVPSRKRDIITINDDEENKEINNLVVEKLHPMGRNSARRKLEEKRILDSVSKKISESSSSSKSTELTQALGQIASTIATAISSWHLQQVLVNCSSDVQREYNDEIVRQHLNKLREKVNNKCPSGTANDSPEDVPSGTAKDSTTELASIGNDKVETEEKHDDDESLSSLEDSGQCAPMAQIFINKEASQLSTSQLTMDYRLHLGNDFKHIL